MNTHSRRTVLAGGVAIGTSLAGCLDSGNGSPGGTDDTTTPGTTATSATTTAETTTEETTTEETTTEEMVDDETPLELSNVQFSEAKPLGYRELEPVNDAEFERGQSVYVYFEPQHVARRRVGDDEVEYSLTIDVTILDETDSAVTSFSSDIAEPRSERTDFGEFWVYQEVNVVSDFPTGSFDLELTVTDDLTGDEDTRTLPFSVLEDGQAGGEYVEAFRETLGEDEDFDGTIDRLVVDADDVARLRVNTTSTAETDAWRGDIGYIAGVYAALVDEGWETTQLVAIIESANGTRHRFVVDRADATAWMNDEISTDEFLDRVLATVEEV